MKEEINMEDALNLQEVRKMMDSPGWAVLMTSIAADREKVIRIVSGAQTKGEARKHDLEYFQGVLAGIIRVVDLFDRIAAQYEQMVELSKQRGREDEHVGAE